MNYRMDVKRTGRITGGLMAILALAWPARGADPGPPVPDSDEVFRSGGTVEPPLSRLLIKTEFIEVEAGAWAELSSGAGPTAGGRQLRARVQALIRGGRARLRDLSLTAATSGERVKNESGTFLIHPSEFAPPKAATRGSTTTPAIAVATECRNLGFNVACDPVLRQDGKTVDLSLAPEIVTESGEVRHGSAEAETRYPRFHYLKTSTQVAAPAGEPRLIAVLSDEDPASNAPTVPVLVFVQVDVHAPAVAGEG